MPWKCQEYFILISGVTFVITKGLYKERYISSSHLPLLMLKKNTSLIWHTTVPSLCLDLHCCAQLLAPVSAFSSGFLARAVMRVMLRRSSWGRPCPSQFPSTTLAGGISVTLSVITLSHWAGLVTPETKPSSHQTRRSINALLMIWF